MRFNYIFIILGMFLAYSIFRALYPEEDYYFAKFEHISGIKVPLSAKLVQGKASYPGFHGDFSSCFVLKISSNDFEKIKDKTSFSPAKSTKSTKSCNDNKKYVIEQQGRNAYKNEFMSWYLTSNNEILGYYAQY